MKGFVFYSFYFILTNKDNKIITKKYYLCALKISKYIKMKKRFLIIIFALFLGNFALAQSQERETTLTELQAEKEILETKLTKMIIRQKEAKEFLAEKHKDAFFAFDKNISKKQKKLAKIILRGSKRQERKIKKELKKLNKRIEKIQKAISKNEKE